MAIEQFVQLITSGWGTSLGIIAGASLSLMGIILVIIGLILLLSWAAVGIGGLVLWVWMIVDCLQRKFPTKNEKVVWVVVMVASIFGAGLLLHLLAALVYNFAVRKKNKFTSNLKKEKTKPKAKKK